MATQNKVQFIVEAVDKASGPMKGIEKNSSSMSKNVSSNLESMVGPSTAFAVALGGIGVAGIGVGSEMLSVAGQFEKYHAVLQVATGSSEEATKAMEMMKTFAAKTPFELTELTESFIKFTNRGIKVTATELTKFGDLAASQGKSFDMLTEAVLDATSGEFERLKEFGIKASKAGDNVTVSFKGMSKTVKNSQDEIQKALLDFGGMDGIAGSMAAVSKTWEGVISNLKDAWGQFLAGQGSKILEFFKGFVLQLTNFIQNDLPRIITGLENFFDALSKNTPAIYGIAAAVITALVPAIVAAAVAMAPFILAAIELATIAGVVGGAVYLLAQAWETNLGGIQEKTRAVWDFLTAAFNYAVTNWLPPIISFIQLAGAEFMKIANEWFPIIQNAMLGIGNIIQTVFGVILAVVTPIVQYLVGFISDNWGTIKAITVAIFDGFLAYFQLTWGTLIGIFKAALQVLGGDWAGAWETLKETFFAFWTALGTIFSALWEVLVGIMTLAWQAFKEFLFLEWEGLKLIWQMLWQGMADVLSGIWAALKLSTETIWNAIAGALKTVWNGISLVASTVWNGIKDLIFNAFTSVIDWFVGIGKGLFEAGFTGMLSGLVGITKSIFNGVIGFIEGFINRAINGINTMINAANDIGGAVGINIGTVNPVSLGRLAHGGIAGQGMFGGRSITGQAGIDNVPTMLSAGEVVLNAAGQNNVARRIQGSDQSPSITVNISGNSFYGDDESFVQKIGDTIINNFKMHAAFQSF